MVSGRTLALNENHRAAVLHVVGLNIKASVFAIYMLPRKVESSRNSLIKNDATKLGWDQIAIFLCRSTEKIKESNLRDKRVVRFLMMSLSRILRL